MATNWQALAAAAAKVKANKGDEAKALLEELQSTHKVYVDESGLHVTPTSTLLASQIERIKANRDELINLIRPDIKHQWLMLQKHYAVVFGVGEADLKENIALAKRDPFRGE